MLSMFLCMLSMFLWVCIIFKWKFLMFNRIGTQHVFVSQNETKFNWNQIFKESEKGILQK